MLTVDNLHIHFHTFAGLVSAVRGVSFKISQGETVGLVGESGCGKTATAQGIMGLLPENVGFIDQGHIRFQEKELTTLSSATLRKIRGRHISMIFQDPMTSLNPTMRVGDQVAEGMRLHLKLSHTEARQRVLTLFQEVGIPDPKHRLDQFPHQFSGGMRQRVGIAIALACDPQLLIADEPTTALDVTIQAQILALLKALQKKNGLSILLITHDLGVVATLCDRVVVMYAGKVMEEGPVQAIFEQPGHPYTQALLAAVPNPRAGRNKALKAIWGTPPDLLHPPTGCPFWPRCDYTMKVCNRLPPKLDSITQDQYAACWRHHPLAQGPR